MPSSNDHAQIAGAAVAAAGRAPVGAGFEGRSAGLPFEGSSAGLPCDAGPIGAPLPVTALEQWQAAEGSSRPNAAAAKEAARAEAFQLKAVEQKLQADIAEADAREAAQFETGKGTGSNKNRSCQYAVLSACGRSVETDSGPARGLGLNLFSSTATQRRQQFELTLGPDNAKGVPIAYVNLPTGDTTPLKMAGSAWLLRTHRGTASSSNYSKNARGGGDKAPESQTEDARKTASPHNGGAAEHNFRFDDSALDEEVTTPPVEPELPVDELPAVEAEAQDMPAEPPMTRAPTGAELGEPADASETAAPTGAGTDGAEAGAQEEIAPRRPPAKQSGSPVEDWHERAQESRDLKGIYPVARYSTALMGKALETKRICVRWPDHSDNDAGWCCVTVKSYVKKRRNPYELLFLHDGAIEKRELLPKFYNTCWDAPIGSWFLADENRSTKLAAVVLDDASRPEPANGIRARVAAARAGDEHWTLDKLIAAITCPGAAEREGSDWPERLTLEDLEGYGHAVATYYDLHKDSPAKGRAYYSNSNVDGTAARDPRTHKEAMESAYVSDWEKAEQAEWDSLVENGVYDEVPVPAGVKPLGSRMVYKTKLKADGSIERHKARIVAQGYSQIPGIDYPEDMTHAPVVRHTSVKAVLAVAAKRSISRKKPWKVHGMDVSTAYLQSPLDEPVHVYHPKGFEKYNRRGERLCLRLKKSLYGLKQSANNWNRCIDAWFKEQGFTPNDADPCLYVLRDKAGGIMMLVCLYVDDLLIAGSDEDIAGFKAAINARFTMKDLGELSYLLGMEISFQDGAVHISQKKYIDEMLDIYGMSDCKPAPTPTLDGQRLTKAMQATTDEDKKEMQGVRYRHAVGHLLYLTSITRFDIANPVRELARFMENPGPEHWAAVKRVFRYLAGTKGKDLILGPFPPGELKLIGYSDSDWAGDPDTRRSTTGYVFVLGDEQSNICSGAISANSRLQPTVALSSTEAEYMAVCSAAAEAIYLRALIGGLGYPQTAATIIYEDNQSAMALANAAINQWHPRTRHMDVRYKFVKERVRSNEVRLVYVRTVEQLADVLTKNLGGNTFRKFAALLLGHR